MMWYIILFLMRPYLVVILSVTSRKDKMGLIDMVYVDKLSLSLSAYAALPVVLLLYAFLKRSPGASNFIKRIWSNGQHLLAATSMLHIIILSAPLFLQKVTQLNAVIWAQLVICMVIIVTVYRSRYIKDCFADFPEISDKKDGEDKNDTKMA